MAKKRLFSTCEGAGNGEPRRNEKVDSVGQGPVQSSPGDW